MDKVELIKKIEDIPNLHNRKKILELVKQLPGSSKISLKPNKIKKGDVFMHTVFKHPYVYLEKKSKNLWLCGLLTSNGDYEQVLTKCESRFFKESYFVKTLFTMSENTGDSFMCVYDNTRQLNKITKELKSIF